ncbi:DNA cytosine methyltransferase [Streptomyces albiaxialis]|uniref:Cytosine-specific methyltransferase n=1 Tax=Streptomyces albiaxialis TaxID=329523 RepID=A0ABP5HAK9_9ACTN
MKKADRRFTSVEVCAGAGGQAVGLHQAEFRHLALIEIDEDACNTLRANVQRKWKDCHVLKRDLKKFNVSELGLRRGQLDLLAGGVPCPPFSVAGHQLGPNDERDLFPDMLSMVEKLQPKAVMIENVRGLVHERFHVYRQSITRRLKRAGYEICMWDVMEAHHYGVPQLRPRAILVAMRPEYAKHFKKPAPSGEKPVTVGDALWRTMRERFKNSGNPDWKTAYQKWHRAAKKDIAPTLVGGSKKHGGADLGPTRAKRAWGQLKIDGMGVANDPDQMIDPERDLYGERGPKLTVRQAAIIQGFPKDWKFTGKKTAAYRQVGNAFPPPVARAVGEQIREALKAAFQNQVPEAVLFELSAQGSPRGGPALSNDSADPVCAGVG